MTPGLLRRLGAIAYDLLIVGAILMAATAATLPFTDGHALAAGTLWYQLYLAGIVLVYFAGFWWRGGQTIGMVAWRLRMRAENGQAVSLTQCIVRALTAVLSGAVAGLGFFWVLIDKQGRGWHDRLSHTRLTIHPILANSQQRDAGDDNKGHGR